MKAQNLKNEIENLKGGRTLKTIKAEDKKLYYKIKGMTSKLSELKAYENGNFLKKEHLVEYKNLIIWILNNKSNFRGYLNLKEAMAVMLRKVENEEIVYITEKGIKGIVSNLALSVGLENSRENMIKQNKIDTLTENTYNNDLLRSFVEFKMNQLK